MATLVLLAWEFLRRKVSSASIDIHISDHDFLYADQDLVGDDNSNTNAMVRTIMEDADLLKVSFINLWP
ncbi:hypothetical protein SUGI_1095370 [Cryptomeria japonica]|nr:hypothetical protein SUGI_1095370 [Cryptomeria japonica]